MRRLLIAALLALSALGLTTSVASATAHFHGGFLWSHSSVVIVDKSRIDVQAPTCAGTFTVRFTYGDHHTDGECLGGQWFGATSWPLANGLVRARLTDQAGTVDDRFYALRFNDEEIKQHQQCQKMWTIMAFLYCKAPVGGPHIVEVH
jgi:hypothetical protein